MTLFGTHLKHTNQHILSNIAGRPLLQMLQLSPPLLDRFRKRTLVCTTQYSQLTNDMFYQKLGENYSN